MAVVAEQAPKKYLMTFREEWRRAVMGLDVNGSWRVVFWHLAQLANADGENILASLPYLSERTHIGEMTVRRALDYGREQHWLHREKRGHEGVASSYSLTFPEWFKGKDEEKPDDQFFDDEDIEF